MMTHRMLGCCQSTLRSMIFIGGGHYRLNVTMLLTSTSWSPAGRPPGLLGGCIPKLVSVFFVIQHFITWSSPSWTFWHKDPLQETCQSLSIASPRVVLLLRAARVVTRWSRQDARLTPWPNHRTLRRAILALPWVLSQLHFCSLLPTQPSLHRC